MKLQGTIMVEVSQVEEDRVNQLLNGCKYFKKYYTRLSLFYGGIDRMKLDRLTESLEKARDNFKAEKTTYDMAIWFVLLKYVKVMEMEYLQHVGLVNCLYLEFLRMQQKLIRYVIEDIWDKIYKEEG